MLGIDVKAINAGVGVIRAPVAKVSSVIDPTQGRKILSETEEAIATLNRAAANLLELTENLKERFK